MRHLTHSLRAVIASYSIRSRRTLPAALCLGLAVVAVLPGCQFSSYREAGTMLGGGLGALTGAAIGQQSGHTAGGALIGALAGGIAGNLVGGNEDMRMQRDAAVAQAQYLASTGQILTNTDVIRMVQCGLSDEVIITTIRSSYGKYDLHPEAIIQLKTCGASDQVIIELQQVVSMRAVTTVGYVPRPAPSVGLVVAPAPVVMFGRPGYCGPYHRRW